MAALLRIVRKVFAPEELLTHHLLVILTGLDSHPLESFQTRSPRPRRVEDISRDTRSWTKTSFERELRGETTWHNPQVDGPNPRQAPVARWLISDRASCITTGAGSTV